MWDAGKKQIGFGIKIDLSKHASITDAVKFDSEADFNLVVKSLRESYASSANKPEHYSEVVIINSNGVAEELTFDALRARLFQK